MKFSTNPTEISSSRPRSTNFGTALNGTGLTLGPTTGNYAFDPRVVYDPASGRWYASALDQGVAPGCVGPPTQPNDILLAVSVSSDPTAGWIGFVIRTDTTNVNRADFDSLGFNGDSVVVTANMFNIDSGNAANPTNVAMLSVPKAELLSASAPNAPIVMSSLTFTNSLPASFLGNSTPADSFDPAVFYDSTGDELLISQSTNLSDTTGVDIVLETVSGGGAPAPR